VSVVQFESAVFHVEILNSKVVGFQDAALVAIDQVILLCDVRFAVLVLEEKSAGIGVKRFYFFIGL
jgi:hypothetical protein